jgi:threonine synthase
MQPNFQLLGSKTQHVYNTQQPIWYGNNELLNIKQHTTFNPDAVKQSITSLWRYDTYLPLSHQHAITLGEGFTPILPIAFKGKTVLIKQEHLFPTGSYKDRGASVLMSYAKQLGVTKVVQDSSGNAGCAIAAYGAKGNIDTCIFVPASTSAAKLAQIRMYGATLNLVEGTREDTAKAAWQAAQQQYYASHCYNPFFYEGTKTFAYEVCEQLNWTAPDVVVLPVGNGTLVLGCYIGFLHLLESGVISQMPKIVGVQASNCAPLYHQWNNNHHAIATTETFAEGIAIAEPIRANEIVEAIRKTDGILVTVDEHDIVSALKECCQMGYYIEPTSAATIAGIYKALQHIEADNWVSLFTGHGLKATDKMLQLLSKHN